jgi:hypothetical protein
MSKKYGNVLTTHTDAAWRTANVKLFVDKTPYVAQLLVRRLSYRALIGRNTAASYLAGYLAFVVCYF